MICIYVNYQSNRIFPRIYDKYLYLFIIQCVKCTFVCVRGISKLFVKYTRKFCPNLISSVISLTSYFILSNLYILCSFYFFFFIFYHTQLQTTTLCVSVSICASVALACLFAPKVYIIVFQPHKNVRRLSSHSSRRSQYDGTRFRDEVNNHNLYNSGQSQTQLQVDAFRGYF